MKKLTLLLFLLILCQCLNAQISGTVYEKGTTEPLIGATVLNTTNDEGTTTDTDGSFSLNGTIGDILEISYVGYAVKTITTESSNVTIYLSQGQELEAITVVGSRGKPRTDVERPVPVDVVNAKELASTGQTDLGQQVQYSSPSFNSAKYGVNGTTNYADPASLRGMGPDQSLVLVNGKRRHQFSTLNLNVAPGLGNVVTDLNSLPSNAVKRMEVLRDGAAAQYGSDAIAGIINIALKDQNDGGSFQTTVGQHFSSPDDDASEGRKFRDGFTIKNSLNYGFSLGKEKSFFNFTLEHFKFAGTNRSDYYSGTIYPSVPDDQPRDSDGNIIPTDDYPYTTEDPLGDRNVYPNEDFVVGNYGSNENETKQFFINVGYPLNDNGLQVYANGGYSDKFITAYGFFRNPGRFSRAVLSVFPDGYVPISPGTSTDYSYTAGISNSTIDGWNWDLGYSKGHNDLFLDIFNTTNPSFGSATETFFHVGTYNTEQDVVNADISKRLDVSSLAGLNVAFGAQFRSEKYWQTIGSEQSFAAGPLASEGKDVGSSARPGIADENEVDRSNFGIYADVEADISNAFLVAAAARFENYSDFGGNISGKLAARYKLTDNFSVRGSYNRGFRAPSVSQLGTINNTSTVQNGQIVITRQVEAADERLAQLGISQPEAEISNNLNLGVTAKLMDGALLLTADAYQITIDDRIVISERLNTGNFPAVANLFPDSREIRFFTNHADTKTQGIDIVASYKKAFGENHSLNLSVAATFNNTEVTGQKDTPSEILEGSTGQEDFKLLGQTAIELIEVAIPRQKLLLSGIYTYNNIGVTLRFTRYGSVQAFSNGLSPDDSNTICNEDGSRCVQEFAPKVVTDLAGTWHFSETFSLTAGANNLLDVYPDKYNTSRNGFAGSASSYASGQIPYSRNSNQFGFNGRYLYLTGTMNF
jgi:iron complex outermembrane receptor protein